MKHTLPNRQSIRLKNWDYKNPAFYFVTICTYGRQNLFENQTFCEIATNELLNLPQKPYAQHLVLDKWVVMPNHIHAIFGFTVDGHSSDLSANFRPFNNAPKGSLGSIVGQYKSSVTIKINRLCRRTGVEIWQRGYYEHIIRDEKEWRSIQQYIVNNPIRWAEDKDNLDVLIAKMNLT